MADIMHLLDSTITAPTISSSLHGGPGLIKWLGVSYAPVLGVPLVILGHLRISTTWRFRPTPTRLPAAMRSRDFTTWSTIARTRPAATASSYSGQFSILKTGVLAGAPGRTRTCDRLLRRQLLYPAELQAPTRTLCPMQITRRTRLVISLAPFGVHFLVSARSARHNVAFASYLDAKSSGS